MSIVHFDARVSGKNCTRNRRRHERWEVRCHSEWVGSFRSEPEAIAAEIAAYAAYGETPPEKKTREPAYMQIETPPCFTEDIFRKWQADAVTGSAGRAYMAEDYCRDCTPEYKAQMMREGRCNRPETFFRVLRRSEGDQDGALGFELQGICRRPYVDYDKALKSAIRNRMIVERGEQVPGICRAWMQRNNVPKQVVAGPEQWILSGV